MGAKKDGKKGVTRWKDYCNGWIKKLKAKGSKAWKKVNCKCP